MVGHEPDGCRPWRGEPVHGPPTHLTDQWQGLCQIRLRGKIAAKSAKRLEKCNLSARARRTKLPYAGKNLPMHQEKMIGPAARIG
jgi:hypothetical protein